jgi:hypothetical protein
VVLVRFVSGFCFEFGVMCILFNYVGLIVVRV